MLVARRLDLMYQHFVDLTGTHDPVSTRWPIFSKPRTPASDADRAGVGQRIGDTN